MLEYDTKDWSKNSTIYTLIETTHLQPPMEDFIAPKQSHERYQSAVGLLMYAMISTWPDIAYVIFVVSRYTANPDDSCWTAVKQIFWYL